MHISLACNFIIVQREATSSTEISVCLCTEFGIVSLCSFPLQRNTRTDADRCYTVSQKANTSIALIQMIPFKIYYNFSFICKLYLGNPLSNTKVCRLHILWGSGFSKSMTQKGMNDKTTETTQS